MVLLRCYFVQMKKIQLLFFSLILVMQAFAQADFEKLKQEYVSRKPYLDTMRAYPDVPFDSIKVMSSEGISISFWLMSRETRDKGQRHP